IRSESSLLIGVATQLRHAAVDHRMKAWRNRSGHDRRGIAAGRFAPALAALALLRFASGYLGGWFWGCDQGGVGGEQLAGSESCRHRLSKRRGLMPRYAGGSRQARAGLAASLPGATADAKRLPWPGSAERLFA